MSANDLIPFWEQKFKNGCLAAILNLSNFVIIKYLKKMQNSWTMNIKKNGRSHTMITHDKFRTVKSKMAASRPFQFFPSLSRKSCMRADLRTSALSYFTYPSHTAE